MIIVASFLDRLAPGLYILLAAVFMWNLWKTRRMGKQHRAMYFELEREVMRLRRVNAMTLLVVVAMGGLILLGIQRSVLPFLRQVQDIQAIQQEVALVMDGAFVTSVPRNSDDAQLDIVAVGPLGGDDVPIVIATPAPTLTPVGTMIPNAPDIEGCTDPRAVLRLPANGMRVFQPVTVEGVAYTDNFSEAKLEIRGPATSGAWASFLVIPQPALTMQPLGQFVPAPYISIDTGVYQLRLMVFDFTGQPVASCMVNIYLTTPPETPTPTVTQAS